MPRDELDIEDVDLGLDDEPADQAPTPPVDYRAILEDVRRRRRERQALSSPFGIRARAINALTRAAAEHPETEGRVLAGVRAAR